MENESSNNNRSSSLDVVWEGSFVDLGSLSYVNRSIVAELEKMNSIRLTCVSSTLPSSDVSFMPEIQKISQILHAVAPVNTEITVRHQWPPNWSPPSKGLWILMQPWEFGRIPLEWVERIKKIDEVWVPTYFVKKQFTDSGVPTRKVVVIPNGIDPSLFNPQVNPISLQTNKKFKFLFVGGTIYRKGIDILMNSYFETFTNKDDVSLIIKDVGTKSFYPNSSILDLLKELQNNPSSPEVIYLNEEVSVEQMASYYTACDCLVHPYRGEGFALPILEAMASGLPVIVTKGGASDDFMQEEFGWLIPSEIRSIGNTVYTLPLVGEGWMLEPDKHTLSKLMREAFNNPLGGKIKGALASDYVINHWNWKKSAEKIEKRLKILSERSKSKMLK